MLKKEKVEYYFSLTEKAFKKLKIKSPQNPNIKKITEDYLRLSKCYYEDAKHFLKNNDLVNAFAAINYAHAFLDAGAILGVFDIGKKDSKLLMVDK
ncbi:MAG: DUF357 domain-containing protein [Candidatus Woesearchaeota archaeon]|nr:DUF357 domain-containing protein [Bacteroidota bacterium]